MNNYETSSDGRTGLSVGDLCYGPQGWCSQVVTTTHEQVEQLPMGDQSTTDLMTP